jgi:hypothetical protein
MSTPSRYIVQVNNRSTGIGGQNDPLLFLIVWNGGNTRAVTFNNGDIRVLPMPDPPPVGTECWIRVTRANGSETHDSEDNFTIQDAATTPGVSIYYDFNNWSFSRTA